MLTHLRKYLLSLVAFPLVLFGSTTSDSISYDIVVPERYENLWQLGLAADEEGLFVEALDYIDSSFCLLQEEVGINHPFSATALNHLGNIYYKENYLSEAFYAHSQALGIRQQYFGSEHLETAKSYNNLANCYLAIGDYDTAIALYQQTVQIRESSKKAVHEDLAAAYNNLGNIYLTLGKWLSAKKYYKKALIIRRDRLGEMHLKTAQSQLSLGNVFAAEHQVDSALVYFRQALRVYENEYEDDDPNMAELYENMGNAMMDQQQFHKAAELLSRSLEIRQKNFRAAHPKLIQSYQNLGELWLQRGDYQLAYQHAQHALDLLLSAWGEYHPQVAYAYEQVGLSLLYLGKMAEAKLNLEQAIALRQSLFGHDHPFVAGSFLNLGNVYWQEGNFEEARSAFYRSIRIWNNQLQGWNPELFKAYINISQTYLEQKSPEQALLGLESAQLYLDTNQLVSIASYFRVSADVHRQLLHFSEAHELLEQALETLQYNAFNKQEKIDQIPPLELLHCLQSRGQNQLAWGLEMNRPGQVQEALQYLEEAIDWLAVLQNSYSNPEAKQQIVALYPALFENAIEACLYLAEASSEKIDYYKKALVLSERNKSIRLLETTARYREGTQPGVDTLIQQWQQCLLHINQLEKRLLLKEISLDKKEQRKAQNELFDWQQKRNEIDKILNENRTSAASQHLYLTFEKITELQEEITKGEAILSFFQGKEHLYAFVLNAEGAFACQLDSMTNWQASIQRLGNSIIQFPDATSQKRRHLDIIYTRSARDLYQRLFLQLEAHLVDVKNLQLIPDGIFNWLPFEALLTADVQVPMRYRSYPFLMHDYTISYAYSISQWLDSKGKNVDKVPVNRACLAVAPTFDGTDSDYAPLEHNKLEAEAVLTHFQGQLITGESASISQFLNHASDYAILHLATHAQTNIDNGDYAYLVLSSEGIDKTKPYSKLFVKDLYPKQWKAQLAVLSACETGIGSFKAGEGVLSIGRGFAQAGVRSSVSSLWQINDAHTALLMENFYQNLNDGKRKDDALRMAKVDLLKESTHDMAHPFYWASYIPYGDMKPIQIASFFSSWLFRILLLTGILFAALIINK